MHDPVSRAGIFVLIICVVGVVVAGYEQRTNPERYMEFLIGENIGVTQTGAKFTDTIVIGAEMTTWGNWCKTDISDTWTATFDLTFRSPVNYVAGVGWTDYIRVYGEIPGAPPVYLLWTGQHITDGITYNDFEYGIGGGAPGDPIATVSYEADGSMHTLSCSISVDVALKTRHGVDPIGTDKSGDTHSKECFAEDGWFPDSSQQAYVSIGTLSWDGAATSDIDPDTAKLEFTVEILCHDVTGDIVRLENITFSEVAIDAGLLEDTELDPIQSGGSWTGEKLHVVGDGSNIRYYFEAKTESAKFEDAPWAKAPFSYAFTGLSVWDADGSLLGELEVTCPAVQIASGGTWSSTTKTISDWQSYAVTQDWGCYSWDADPPPDDAVKLTSDVYFYIDKDSAQSFGLEGFQESSVSGLSFDHDGRIIINGWPLNKTARDVSPFVDDIVTIDHKDNVGIYDLALSHTDWSPSAGVTTPDVSGNFTVNEPKATLTLSPVQNYVDRLQTKIPAQTAPEGIPEAYIKRRSNVYAAETDESVYCWAGWRYLKMVFTVPVDCNVTCQITFYGPGSHSDNHYSDSSRQTDYVYNAGSTTTLSSSVALEAGSSRVALFDFPSTVPINIVTEVKLIFDGTGEWKLSEPTLVLDPGDNDREAVIPHWVWKWFEHYKNAYGGGSAVVEGQYSRSLWWPDNYKANTFEATAGNFDYVVGKTSGIDLSSAWSLATFFNLIKDSCNAWETTYDNNAEDDATTDDDDNTLKTLKCYDLRPCIASVDTSPDVAIRVCQWGAASGLEYDWNAEKYVMGQAHGWVGSNSSPVRNGTGELYRRDEPEAIEWTKVQDISGDGHGYWRSNGHEVVYEYSGDTATYYKYATSSSGSPLIGRFATREWVVGLLGGEAGDGRFSMIPLLPTSRLLHFYATADGIYHIYSNPEIQYWVDSSEVQAGYTNPMQDTSDGVDDHPSAIYNGSGRLRMFWVRDGGVYTQYSDDMGGTWSGEIQVLAGYDRAFFWQDANIVSPIIHCAAIDSSGTLVYAYSTDGATTFSTPVSIDMGVTVKQPSGITTPKNRLCIIYHKDGEEKLAYSDDGGQTWSVA